MCTIPHTPYTIHHTPYTIHHTPYTQEVASVREYLNNPSLSVAFHETTIYDESVGKCISNVVRPLIPHHVELGVLVLLGVLVWCGLTPHHTPYTPYTTHHTLHTPYTIHHTPYIIHSIHHTPYTPHQRIYWMCLYPTLWCLRRSFVIPILKCVLCGV